MWEAFKNGLYQFALQIRLYLHHKHGRKFQAVIVSRHPGFVEYAKQQFCWAKDAPVYDHIDHYSMIEGKTVFGNLPLELVWHASELITLDLTDVPKELRGSELTLDQVKQYQRGWHRYEINRY